MSSDQPPTAETRTCPDGDTCHHACDVGCWRARTSSPLSGIYPDDEWPQSVSDAPASYPASLRGLAETIGHAHETGRFPPSLLSADIIEPYPGSAAWREGRIRAARQIAVRKLIQAAVSRADAKRARTNATVLVQIQLTDAEAHELAHMIATPWDRLAQSDSRYAALSPNRIGEP